VVPARTARLGRDATLVSSQPKFEIERIVTQSLTHRVPTSSLRLMLLECGANLREYLKIPPRRRAAK